MLSLWASYLGSLYIVVGLALFVMFLCFLLKGLLFDNGVEWYTIIKTHLVPLGRFFMFRYYILFFFSLFVVALFWPISILFAIGILPDKINDYIYNIAFKCFDFVYFQLLRLPDAYPQDLQEGK